MRLFHLVVLIPILLFCFEIYIFIWLLYLKIFLLTKFIYFGILILINLSYSRILIFKRLFILCNNFILKRSKKIRQIISLVIFIIIIGKQFSYTCENILVLNWFQFFFVTFNVELDI